MLTLELLERAYPRLWHMTDPRNARGILAHGLLSTSRLLQSLEMSRERRDRYERERRPHDLVFARPDRGAIVLRDQKPLDMSRLASLLTSGTPAEYVRFINGRIFFWTSETRLAAMNAARSLRDRDQIVIVLRTASLLASRSDTVRVSRINSGATMRRAVKRSIDTLAPLSAYDWTAGRRAIAEVTLEGAVPDLWDHVDRVEVWRNGARRGTLAPPWSVSLLEAAPERPLDAEP